MEKRIKTEIDSWDKKSCRVKDCKGKDGGKKAHGVVVITTYKKKLTPEDNLTICSSTASLCRMTREETTEQKN